MRVDKESLKSVLEKLAEDDAPDILIKRNHYVELANDALHGGEELKIIVDGAMSQLARAKVKCDSVREGISTLLGDIELISQERDQAISLLKSLSDFLGCSPVMLDAKVKQLKEIAESKSPGIGSLPKTGFIRRFQLAKALSIHVATIDRWVSDGKIPRPVKLGEKVTAFKAEEIQEWLKEGGEYE